MIRLDKVPLSALMAFFGFVLPLAHAVVLGVSTSQMAIAAVGGAFLGALVGYTFLAERDLRLGATWDELSFDEDANRTMS
jgi:hypothetical protein